MSMKKIMTTESNPEYWASSEYIDEGPYNLAALIKKSTTRNNTKSLVFDWVIDKYTFCQPLNYFFAIENEVIKFGQTDRDCLGRLNRYRHQHPDAFHTIVFNKLYKGKTPRLYVRLAEGQMVNFSSGKQMCYENTAEIEARNIIRYENAVGRKPVGNSKIG